MARERGPQDPGVFNLLGLFLEIAHSNPHQSLIVSDGGVCLVYLSQAIASVHEEAMGIPFLFCAEWSLLMVHDLET